LVTDLAPELGRYFVSCGDSGFDAVDAALGEPMLDVGHETLANVALSVGLLRYNETRKELD